MNMKEISGERYREILRYIIALEEAEDFSNAVIELLRYVIPYDAALYIQLDRRGLLIESYAVTPGVECGAPFYDKAFTMKDPVFDFGNRASGMPVRAASISTLMRCAHIRFLMVSIALIRSPPRPSFFFASLQRRAYTHTQAPPLTTLYTHDCKAPRIHQT